MPCGNPEFKKQPVVIDQAQRMYKQVGSGTESCCSDHILAPIIGTLLGSLEKRDIDDIETVEGPPDQTKAVSGPVHYPVNQANEKLLH
jgi:hypothetical protein